VKRWHYIVLLGLGISGVAYVYLHRQELGLAGPHSFGSSEGTSSDAVLSPRPAHINWQTVDRPGDGFKGEMPSDTKEIQIPAYNESNGSEPVNMIFSNPDGGTAFAVAWANNPPVMRRNGQAADRTLEMARMGRWRVRKPPSSANREATLGAFRQGILWPATQAAACWIRG